MPYDNMSAGNPRPDMATDEYPAGEGEEATTTLPASVTGGKTFNVGDEIVLEVVETMEDGSLVVKYATGKGDEDEGTNWEDDFRQEMSPREPQTEAM